MSITNKKGIVMKKIVSWNVASLRARKPLVDSFLEKENPDVLLLQEIKMETDLFPTLDFQSKGYDSIAHGQKSWNGVAVLSKTPLKLVSASLPGFQDQARFIEVETKEKIRYISIYVPNGTAPLHNPEDSSRLEYKLRFLDTLTIYVKSLLKQNINFILGGDFNIIFEDKDVYNPELFRDSALMIQPVRDKLKEFLNTGVLNTLKDFRKEESMYTFWDFQGGAWFKNQGIFLDTIYVSPLLKDKVTYAGVMRSWRGENKPSDHAPVCCFLGM